MDQYQIIENLIDLYSPDDEVRLEALLAKKEWILDRFYVPYSILPTSEDGYSDLYALKNQALAFHKINLPNITNKSTPSIIQLNWMSVKKVFECVRKYFTFSRPVKNVISTCNI